MLVTSWAFTVLRRCKSADGKTSSGSIVQAPGHFEDLPAGQVLEIVVVQLGQRLQRLAGIMDQPPNQAFFRMFQLPERRAARAAVTVGPLLDRGLTDFGAHHVFRNPRLVRDPVRELVAGGGVRNPGRDRQHLAQELPPAVVVAEVEPAGRLIEQVFQIRPRGCAAVHDTRRAPLRLMNVSGSSPLSSTTTLTSNPSATSSSHDRDRRALAGRVGVEAEHDLRREPAEQLRLLRRQRRAARGDHRRRLRLKHLREIEIALDQDREAELPDRRLVRFRP